jgi:hypothetical protein
MTLGINRTNTVPVHIVAFDEYRYPPRRHWSEELDVTEEVEQGNEDGPPA